MSTLTIPELLVKEGIEVPTFDEIVAIRGLVHVAQFNRKGELIHGEIVPNLVTQVGDQYYGERAAGIASPPGQITGMHLGTGATAAAKTGAGAAIVTYLSGSNVAIDGGFPTSSIPSTARRISWQTTWTAGVATNAAITEAVIVNQTIATNSAATAANTIARALISSVNKGVGDSLVITWTHDLLGA